MELDLEYFLAHQLEMIYCLTKNFVNKEKLKFAGQIPDNGKIISVPEHLTNARSRFVSQIICISKMSYRSKKFSNSRKIARIAPISTPRRNLFFEKFAKERNEQKDFEKFENFSKNFEKNQKLSMC